ncbi:hypothetical protein GGI17_006049 [Coemansia sp. S146]|nr:hypothetical protein GGI17_006049 [Coemansia sp. S146]
MPSTSEQPLDNATASPGTESNISAFVQLIKQITPMMKDIRISILTRDFRQHQLPVQHLDNLAAQLSQHVTDIDYEFYNQPVIIDQRLGGLCKLVYSTIDSNDGGEQIIQLARRNALTLQLLDIDVDANMDTTGLIRNADGSYVQYSCLHTFNLTGPQDLDESRPPFPDALPFPSLRHLQIKYVYPFGDDTVFKGNAATLESLFLSPSPSITRVLQVYKIFTPVSHPRLQRVKVQLDMDSEPSLFDSDVDYMQFVLSIGPNAPVRDISGLSMGPRFQYIPLMLGEYTSIQVLNLGALHLNLWDVIALVKVLPLLSDLHTMLPVLGPQPDRYAEHELPAYVIANYAPTGKRFRCWSFIFLIGGDLKSAVRCVLLLALVCPNFDYAVVVEMKRELFMAHMSEMTITDEFRPHESRLRRLLFGGSKNEIRSVNSVLAAEEAARTGRA